MVRKNIRNFAAVNVMMKRHIASWVLLAVFVPMLVMSSLHVHVADGPVHSYCNECVQHHCQGHVAAQGVAMHACVLCQFLTFSFLPATVFAVMVFSRASRVAPVWPWQAVRPCACGMPLTRAPPVV